MAQHRILLASTLLATAFCLTACPGEDKPEIIDDGGIDLSCQVDEDCPTEANFRCDQTTSECVASCRTREDCGAEARGQYALPECAGTSGCQCDVTDVGGVCTPAFCSNDADCGGGGLVCRSGACVAPPDAALASSCRVAPEYVVAREGETLEFFATANAADGSAIVVPTVSWTALNNLATVTENRAHFATFTLSMPTTGSTAVEAVKAVIGTAECTARAVILPAAVTAGQVRTVVVDELSGRPLEGVRVIVSNAGTGAIIDNDLTDAAGVASLTAAGSITVTAAHQDYTYVTYANYALPAGGGDLIFPLRRNPVDRYGGFKGTFSGVEPSANIQAGLAAMSVAGSPVDLSLSQLLGRTVPTDISIAGQNFEDLPLPAGTFLRFNNTGFKDDIEGQGLASTCTDAFAGGSAESLILDGACGTRAAWGLTADDVLFTELPLDAIRDIEGNVGQALSQSLPLLRKFRHSLVRDVQFRLEPTPGAGTGSHDFSQTGFFTEQNLPWQQMPLGFSFAIRVPSVPLFNNQRMDSVIALTTVSVPGRGLIPMGLGAAVNEDGNEKTDKQDVFEQEGVMRVRSAPAHSGVETTDYGLTVLATSLSAATGDASVGLATSGLFQRFENNSLVFDGEGANPVAVNGSFIDVPTGARYDFRSGARQFLFSGTPSFTADQVIRVIFTDRLEHRWVVHLAGNQATTGFKLPALQAGWNLDDRTFSGIANNPRSTMVLQVLELKKGSASVGLTELATFNSTNLNALAELTTRFSLLDYARPTVSFSSPSPGDANPSVAKNGKITVDVRYFKVGGPAAGEGGVRLSFAGGTGACTSVTSMAENGVKSGQIDVQLPNDCEGPDVDVTATLVDTNGADLDPVVRNTLAIDLTP